MKRRITKRRAGPRRDVSRNLTMQRLALRTVRGDRQAAIVLGDAMHEKELKYIATGRSRNVGFRVSYLAPNVNWPSRIGDPSDWTVKGREMLWNVERFASNPSDEQWNKIFRMWITTHRDIYRDLARQGVIPRSVRFHELEFRRRYHGIPKDSGEGLNYEIYLVRVPPRRKKPVKTRLFNLDRMDRPETITTNFGDDAHLARDPRRRRPRRRRS